jgi:hypothetical protein
MKTDRLLFPEFISHLHLQNRPLVDLLKELQFTLASNHYMSKPTPDEYQDYTDMESLVEIGKLRPSAALRTALNGKGESNKTWLDVQSLFAGPC